MQSKWCQTEANNFIETYTQLGHSEEMALRVYSCRLLGKEPKLVLHGGGNVSVKLNTKDIDGTSIEALCVKGSGWDMSNIEPEGLPALALPPLLPLAERDVLSDEDMVAIQRRHLLNPYSPNPSIETLLHAFLPHRYVDHTHANAILSITNQANGLELIKNVFGDSVAIVPYVKPGFELAKSTLSIFKQSPDVIGIILLQHGIFTFGASAKESYERMIRLVSKAECFIQSHEENLNKTTSITSSNISFDKISPYIRGALTEPFILHHRTSEKILDFSNLQNLKSLCKRTCITPDHVIRTKIRPLALSDLTSEKLSDLIFEHIKHYHAQYESYFKNHSSGLKLQQIDPNPRVIIVPGMGLITLGKSHSDAVIVADLFENTIETVMDAEKLGKHCSLPEKDLFEMEYWSLEQAKLAKKKPLPLSGQIVVITGGLGTIGLATSKRFKALGATVVLFDLESCNKSTTADAIVKVDVTCKKSVKSGFKETCALFGGVDIVISNAGAAWQGEIGTVSESTLKDSFELNFFAHQRVAQGAIEIFLKQNSPGNLLFNISKQAVNPGVNFGPYGIPKAATLALARQYALEYGKHGIRVNAVNPDRIRSGLLTDKLIASRSQARNVDEETYMRGNLLQKEVTAEDVAKAFEHLVFSNKTTGDVTTVDGGNIAAVMR